MRKFNYFPIMKTRDAELKAMSKLSSGVFDHILPIYELTKSRKAKIAPDGDIHRRMLTIKDIQGERPFIFQSPLQHTFTNPQNLRISNSLELGISRFIIFLTMPGSLSNALLLSNS